MTLSGSPAAIAAIASRPAVVLRADRPRPAAAWQPDTIVGTRLEVSLVVDGAALAGYVAAPNGRPRITVAVGGRTVRAELNPKSLCKVQQNG